MDHAPAGAVARPPQVTKAVDQETVVRFDGVSKWYGNVIGLNKLTLDIAPGVTGLLGPNGAGKSTLLQLATGQLKPSQGEVTLFGQAPWNNPTVIRWVGLCPEQDAFYEWMSGYDFIYTCARLTGFSRGQAKDATEQAFRQVRLTEHMHRRVGAYSKGMRQRTKLAQALVHQPDVLFLDEPFTGTDPVARRELMDIVIELADQGHSVVLSSHVLYEVQSLTSYIVLLNRGRLVAMGHIRQIRDLIDKHPHRIVLVCPEPRSLAAQLVLWDGVQGIELDLANHSIVVETLTPDAFYTALPRLASEGAIRIDEVYSEDDNLEAVFRYLVS